MPYAEIIGSPDELVVRPGESIRLTCLIGRSPVAPSFVFWHHEQRLINFDLADGRSRAKISVFKSPQDDHTVLSKLTIDGATLVDTGNYTCAPSNTAPASIYVHVLQGKFCILIKSVSYVSLNLNLNFLFYIKSIQERKDCSMAYRMIKDLPVSTVQVILRLHFIIHVSSWAG